MPSSKGSNTSAVFKNIYPLIEKALNNKLAQWKKVMSSFFSKRSQSLFDIAPCDRIIYNDNDRDELFQALGISVSEIKVGLRDTYYWNINPFKPSQAKDETTIVALCIIKYFIIKNMQKERELAILYLCFSGKFYPSIHYGFFRTVTPAKYRYVMEYVVEYKLSQKYDLKVQGNVIGAIKSVSFTWVEAYAKQFKDFTDEDICYVIQQLHNRIKAFMKNIASLYYEAYENKEYISYDKDSVPDDDDTQTLYHLANNDSFKLQQYVENTMTRLTTNQVDYGLCKQCSDANVKTEEVKSIIEACLNNNQNITLVREFITLLIAVFMSQSEVKDINSVAFFMYAKKPKPNSKDPAIIRMKEILELLLDTNSVSYRKRKHRIATKQSYHVSITLYLALSAIKANK